MTSHPLFTGAARGASETLGGLATIRAYRCAPAFLATALAHVDRARHAGGRGEGTVGAWGWGWGGGGGWSYMTEVREWGQRLGSP